WLENRCRRADPTPQSPRRPPGKGSILRDRTGEDPRSARTDPSSAARRIAQSDEALLPRGGRRCVSAGAGINSAGLESLARGRCGMVPEREGDDSAKRWIRKELGRVRAALPTDTGQCLSAIVCERLASTDGFRHARHVAAYVALRGEPDPAGLVRLALDAGKHVYLPGDAEGAPCFRRADPRGRSMDRGMRLPNGADATVFVVPGVAFDA